MVNIADLLKPSAPSYPPLPTAAPGQGTGFNVAPVKPAVLQTKPRISPQTNTFASLGAGQRAAPDTKPNLGPTADTAPPSGKKKLFSNDGFWEDVASGIQTVPKDAGAFSAFAYGFSGAVLGRRDRKATAAKTAADAAQQTFANTLALNTDRRAANADDRAAAATQLVDPKGNLTTAGMAQLEKAVGEYAIDLGLHDNSMTTADRTAAQAALTQYRKDYTDYLTGKTTPVSTEGTGAAAVGGGKNGAQQFLDAAGNVVDAAGAVIGDLNDHADATMRGIPTVVGDAVKGFADKYGAGYGDSATKRVVDGYVSDTAKVAGAVNDTIGNVVGAVTGKGKPAGSGTADDPYTVAGGFTSQAAVVAAGVPVGGIFVWTDPATGEKSLRRRAK